MVIVIGVIFVTNIYRGAKSTAKECITSIVFYCLTISLIIISNIPGVSHISKSILESRMWNGWNGWKIPLICLWYLLWIIIVLHFGVLQNVLNAFLFSIAPSLFLTIIPHVITRSGQAYWSDMKDHVKYFLFACFGYWDSEGVTRKLLKIDDMADELGDAQAVEAKDVDVTDTIDIYNHVISTTISTRVLLLAFFNICTPFALFVRYTAPFPICVYDEELLKKIHPFYIRNPWKKAYKLYASRFKHDSNKAESDMSVDDIKWLVILRGSVIFFEESRLIQWIRRYNTTSNYKPFLSLLLIGS